MKSHARPIFSDNLVLVPGSELPFMDEWKAVAAHLPKGVALIVTAGKDGTLQRTAQRVVGHVHSISLMSGTVTFGAIAGHAVGAMLIMALIPPNPTELRLNDSRQRSRYLARCLISWHVVQDAPPPQ